jgi:hypothetical protein
LAERKDNLNAVTIIIFLHHQFNLIWGSVLVSNGFSPPPDHSCGGSHTIFVETKNFEIINEESSKQDWNLNHTSNFEKKIVTIINIHTNNVPKGLIERPKTLLIINNNIFIVKKKKKKITRTIWTIGVPYLLGPKTTSPASS